MTYKENPKTKGSGIVCCIPQAGRCPVGCPECFFQSGRSYLKPEDLPNIPKRVESWQVVRVNDGNDSNVHRRTVISEVSRFSHKFFNTSIPDRLEGFPGPVVLTLNPGRMTDTNFHKLDAIPKNLMFVRVRANLWNLTSVVDSAVKYYAEERGVPMVLTFMAYHELEVIPEFLREDYTLRRRTTNEYFAITKQAWRKVMRRFEDEPLVYSCGREGISTGCKTCGNCLREWAATMERMAQSGSAT